jgi:hypothetical protein
MTPARRRPCDANAYENWTKMRTEELDSCARKVPAVLVFVCRCNNVRTRQAQSLATSTQRAFGACFDLHAMLTVRQSDRGRRERTSTGSSQAAPPATPARASGPHRRRHSACAPVSNLALMTSPSALRLLRRIGDASGTGRNGAIAADDADGCQFRCAPVRLSSLD